MLGFEALVPVIYRPTVIQGLPCSRIASMLPLAVGYSSIETSAAFITMIILGAL